MKNINWWKLGVIAIVILALMYWARSCGINSVTKEVKSDTSITTHNDTAHTNPTPTGVLPPDTIKITKWLKPERLEDTLWIDADVAVVAPTDTITELKRLQSIERRYNERVTFWDSAQGKDSSWKVFVNDTLQHNLLTRRSWFISYKDTAIKTTKVLKPKRPLVVSLIASGMGNFKNPVYGEGGGASVTLPNGAAYQAQVFHVPGHRPMVMVSKTWVIRFGKKKK